jgi:gamma-glutamylcyclotransferase (GGCT)/AIG2-like uncharacterized protein YtfP
VHQDCSRRRTITPISTSDPARAISNAIVMVDPAVSADSAAQQPQQPHQPQQLVFVYGSLKRGMANHQRLAGAHFAGAAQLGGLHLYDLGPFPMAVATDDPAAVLQGEIYGVDAAQLAELDRFEGVPRLYARQRHQLSDGRCVWVYVGCSQQVRHVQRITSWPPASDHTRPAPGPAPRR